MKKIPEFTFTRERILPGFDGKECKINPSLVKSGNNMFLSYKMLLLSGSDVFNDTYFVKSVDYGVTFGANEKLERFETREDGVRKNFSFVTEYINRFHNKWFVFGVIQNYVTEDYPTISEELPRVAKFIFKDIETGRYTGELKDLPLSNEYFDAVPHGQVIEYENGDFILTFSYSPKGAKKGGTLAVKYRYENEKLSIVEAGEFIEYTKAARGVCEPSMARLDDKYYLTLRTDEQGLLAVSDDGLNFGEPFAWKWDDGSVLENYNTMQRWIRHKDALYLTYTRKGANNDHVFRHRAPIFMARFDEEKLCLVKDSEVILVPELGARLGNFKVSEISENEFWLITAEWMQPIGCEKYGSDNAIWIAKVKFCQND